MFLSQSGSTEHTPNKISYWRLNSQRAGHRTSPIWANTAHAIKEGWVDILMRHGFIGWVRVLEHNMSLNTRQGPVHRSCLLPSLLCLVLFQHPVRNGLDILVWLDKPFLPSQLEGIELCSSRIAKHFVHLACHFALASDSEINGPSVLALHFAESLILP